MQHVPSFATQVGRQVEDEPEPIVRPSTEIYVTPEMQRACPLPVELWRTIAPKTTTIASA